MKVRITLTLPVGDKATKLSDEALDAVIKDVYDRERKILREELGAPSYYPFGSSWHGELIEDDNDAAQENGQSA